MTAVLPAPRAVHVRPASGPVRSTPARRRRRPVRAILRFTCRWLLRMLVSTAVLAFLGLAVGPHVLDYRTMTMLTGSMAPGINPGDVVVSTPIATQDIQVGMVISYHIPIDDHRVVTHRVIDVQHAADGTVTVQTKGDANDAADPWTAVLTGDTAYQMRAVVPELGTVISDLRDPAVNRVLVYGAPALLAAWMLLTIWRPARDEDTDDDTDDDTDEDTDEPTDA
jgi:signal peptidase